MKSPLAIRILAALVAVGLALGVSYLADEAWGLIALVVALITLVMGIAFFVRAEKRLPLLSDPLVLMVAFSTQFFIVGPLSLPMFDYHIFYQLPLDLIVRALLGFLLLFACFFVAYQSPVGASLGDSLPDFRGGKLKLPGRWAEWVIIGGSVVGIGTFFYYQGGVVEYLSLGYGQAKYSGMYQLPFHTLILGTVLMAWRLADTKHPSRFDVFVFVVLLLGEMVFYGVVLGVRNRLIFLFFSLYTVWIMRRGFTRLLKWSIVPVMIFLLIFFAVWGSVRARSMKDMWRGASNYNRREMTATQTYFKSVAEPFAVACIVMDIFPNVEPYRRGRTMLVTLLGFIPRAVWPDKPIGFGKEVTKYTDGIFYDPRHGHSLTITFLGDFYVNGGWFGIVLGGTIFGFLCRVVAAYTAKGMKRGGVQVAPTRVLVAAIFASSLAEVRADAAVFLAYHGMMTLWLLPTFLFFRLSYSDQDRPNPLARS